MHINQENTQSYKQGATIQISSDYSVISSNYNLFKDKFNEIMIFAFNDQQDQAIQELQSLLQQFPDEPLLLDYLADIYKRVGDQALYQQIIRNNYRQFPYSIFMRCAYADLCLKERRITEAAKAIDYTFDLAALYPKKEVFHIMEIITFQSFLTRYFCSLKEYNRAMSSIHLLYTIDKKLTAISDLSSFILFDILESNLSQDNVSHLLYTYQKASSNSCDCDDEDCDCDDACEGDCNCDCQCHDEDEDCTCESNCQNNCDCGCHNE